MTTLEEVLTVVAPHVEDIRRGSPRYALPGDNLIGYVCARASRHFSGPTELDELFAQEVYNVLRSAAFLNRLSEHVNLVSLLGLIASVDNVSRRSNRRVTESLEALVGVYAELATPNDAVCWFERILESYLNNPDVIEWVKAKFHPSCRARLRYPEGRFEARRYQGNSWLIRIKVNGAVIFESITTGPQATAEGNRKLEEFLNQG